MFKLKKLKSKLLSVCFKLIKANEMTNSLFMISFMTETGTRAGKVRLCGAMPFSIIIRYKPLEAFRKYIFTKHIGGKFFYENLRLLSFEQGGNL